MIRAALAALIEQKITTIREVCEYTGVSDSTVYRWINEGTEPSWDAIRLLIRHLPAEGQRVLLTAITAGTAWQLHHHAAELDVNDDGRVDLNDALDTAIQLVQDAGDCLASVREASKTDRIPREQLLKSVQLLQGVIGNSKLAEMILTQISEGVPVRKQARR